MIKHAMSLYLRDNKFEQAEDINKMLLKKNKDKK